MAFSRGHKGRAETWPGMVSETGDTVTTVEGGPDNMAYPGYVPPGYIRPVMGPQEHEGGGRSAVPNNANRGTESHGVQVDSHVGPKDSYDAVGMTEKSDRSPMKMPEADDNDSLRYEPIKVEIVNQDPDEITRITTTTVSIVPSAGTASGTNAPMGTTPIRVLGKDPHRTRAYVCVVSFTSGGNSANGTPSLPVVISSENQPPMYGFPLPLYTQTPIAITSTDEVWIAGQNIADAGIVAVYTERTTNADRLYGD